LKTRVITLQKQKAKSNLVLVGKVIAERYDAKLNRTIIHIATPQGKRIQKLFYGKHQGVVGAYLYYDPAEKAYRWSKPVTKKKQEDVKNVQRTYIGRVTGDTTVHNFEFRSENSVHELDFVITVAGDHLVLGQVVEIRQTPNRQLFAKCKVLVHLTTDGTVVFPNVPVTPRAPVYKATDRDLRRFFEIKKGLYIGHLFGTRIPVYIDLKKLIIGGTALFGVRRTGKSYLGGVIVEELVDHAFPVLIIDPHGEYIFKYPNDVEDEQRLFKIFNEKPRSYKEHNYVVAVDSSVKEADKYIDIEELSEPEFYIRHIRPGKILTIVTKGLELEEAIEAVYRVSHTTFELRKKRAIPPYFFLLDEIQNYAPQRVQGMPKSVAYTKKKLAHIASEGGKFGIGFFAISQRPAWVEKSVIAPLQNFFVTRIAWKNDKEVVKQSVVGADEYMSVIERRPVGRAYISGITPFPALVSVRVRRTRHMGASVDVDRIMFEIGGENGAPV